MSGNYGLIHSADELRMAATRMLAKGLPIGFDIETGFDGPEKMKAALHPEEAFVVGFSFSQDSSWARYVPLRHDNGANLDPYEVAEIWWPVLNSGLAVSHNFRFELRFMSRWFRQYLPDNPEVKESDGYFPVHFDTMVEAFVEGTEPAVGLKPLTKSIFGHEQVELASLFPIPKGKRKPASIRFNLLELDAATISYACEDAAWCLALHERFYPKVRDNKIYDLDMSLIPILARMEDTGICFNWDLMDETAARLEKFREAVRTQIMELASEQVGTPVDVNLGSFRQVGTLLFDTLGLRSVRTTEKGSRSTDDRTLSLLSADHPVVPLMQKWRSITKIQRSYLTNFRRDHLWSEDGRAHPSHNMTRIASGRFSVDTPNYQQFPTSVEYDLDDGSLIKFNYRDFVICPPGKYLFGFDFSQIELRVAAGLAGEQTMLDAFKNGVDVHSATASGIYSVPIPEVTKEQRSVAKTVNFATLYGSGPGRIADMLGKTVSEAEELQRRYFAGFPMLASWIDRMVEEGQEKGEVRTLFGRRIVIREFRSADDWIFAKGKRLCVNAPVQGAAADYVRTVMVRIDRWLEREGLRDRIQMVMNIHDALEFYVDEDIDPAWLVEQMTPLTTYPIPGFPDFLAEFHHGKTWGSVVDIEQNRKDTEYVSEGSTPRALSVEAGEVTPEVVVDTRDVLDTCLVVSLNVSPYPEEWASFLRLIEDTPGKRETRVSVGDTLLDNIWYTGLDFDYEARIKLIFGAAGLRAEKAAV